MEPTEVSVAKDERNADSSAVKKFFKRLSEKTKIKNIEVVVGIVILAIALIAYAAFKPNSVTDSESSEQKYFSEVEKKLESILSEVEGVGKVDVLITYKGTSRIVPAMSTESKSTEKSDDSFGGSYFDRIETSGTSPVLDGGSVVVVGKEYPEISGVLIVAEGAENIAVRIKILQAASTALAVDPNIIAVLSKGK